LHTKNPKEAQFIEEDEINRERNIASFFTSGVTELDMPAQFAKAQNRVAAGLLET
jgi:hypothetical protein